MREMNLRSGGGARSVPSLRRGNSVLGIHEELKTRSDVLLLERQHAVLFKPSVSSRVYKDHRL